MPDFLSRSEQERLNAEGPRGSDYLSIRERQRIAEERKEARPLFSSWEAGIGAIGLGSLVLGTALARGGLVGNLLHFLGHGRQMRVPIKEAANVGGHTIRSRTAGLRNLEDAFWNVKSGELQLEPVDLIRDLTHADYMLSNANNATARNYIRDQVTEFINRRYSSGGNNTWYWDHRFERITVSEVIKERDRWTKVIGSNQWSTLKRGLDQNLVSGDHILDRKIFATSEGYLRDLRVGRNMAKRFDMFGQAAVFRSLAGSRTNIGLLAPDEAGTVGRAFTGTRYFVGGKIFGFDKEFAPHVLAEGRKLRHAGDPLSVITAHRQGRIKWAQGTRGPLGGLQKALGVGPTYATRPSHLERYVINPMRRLRAIASGKGVVYKAKYMYEGESTATLTGAALVGGHAPELFMNIGRKVVSVPGGDEIVDYAKLGAWDRAKVAFDLHPEYRVIKRSSWEESKKDLRKILSNADLAVPLASGGVASTGLGMSKVATGALDVRRDVLTKVGDRAPGVRSAYYDVKAGPLRGALDMANYAFYRVTNLASESLLGIGFKPGKSVVGSAARLSAIPLIYEGGREAIGYLDYEIENITGFSPIEGLATLYTQGRVALQDLREMLGIQQTLAAGEEAFPGLVDSPISVIARSILAPGAALFALAGKSLGLGAAVAGGIFATVGGLRPGQPAEELAQEYSGERKVPVREGSFWGLGFTPWGGGRIIRYDHSWFHRLKSDFRTNAIYGSRDEYYRAHANVFGIPLPTPRNLFGVRNIIDPYRLEKMHRHDRPYPVTGGFMEEFPMIGPAISATLGQIIKPTVIRAMDPFPIAKAGLVDRGLSASAARDLGIPDMMASPVPLDSPADPMARLSRLASVATEPAGIYKFAMEYVRATFGLGNKRPELASSGAIGSQGRAFYGANLGGALGQTEFMRRFMLSEHSLPNKLRNKINPFKNTMPSWMPGAYSQFERDQGYYLDYTTGDPYVKIDRGEARLPGAGYESLNELHSGIPGVYDAVDRFLVLADVAPYSDAYRQYEAEVSKLKLDDKWQQRIASAVEQRDRVINFRSEYPRYGDQLSQLNMDIKAKGGVYPALRKAYDFITHDVLAEIPYFGTKLAPFRNEEEWYRRQAVEGATFASWNHPYEAIVKPVATNVAYSNPIEAALKGAVVVGLGSMGAAKFLNPFRSLTDNPGFAVKFGALGGAGLSVTRMLSGQDETDIPLWRQQEIERTVYADRLTYLRARTYENMAAQQGKTQLASQFKLQAQRTMVGAPDETMARSALPTSLDRRYFDAFVKSADRKRTMEAVPAYYAQTLNSVWNSTFNNRAAADEETLRYFRKNKLPAPGFLGWHPSASTQAMKIKIMRAGIGGESDYLHRYGFYESQQNELKHRLPDLYEQRVEYEGPTNFDTFNQLIESQQERITSAFGDSNILVERSNTTPYRMNAVYNVNLDRRQDVLYYLQDLMR